MTKRVAILFFISYPAWGTIAFVQHAVGTAAALTITATTAGNTLVVFCVDSIAPTGVTDNGSGGSDTFSESVAARGHVSGANSGAFIATSIKSGVTQVTCATTGTSFGSVAFEYSGTATSSVVETSTGTSAKSCSASPCAGSTITTANSGDVIASYAYCGTNQVTAVAAPYGHFLKDTNGDGSADRIPGSTVTNDAASWTITPTDTLGTTTVALIPLAVASPSVGGTININSGTGNIQLNQGTGKIVF